MSLLLSCRSITKSYGVRTLFKSISLSFDEGERIGLVGLNGSGKSTLLKILAGVELPDEGELIMRRGLRLGYLPQEDVFSPGASVQEVLTEALADQHLEEHQRQTQVAVLLGKMGFDRPEVAAGSLSGGWRKRLALARQLIRKPDMLLLDEPTNHLDLEGILWLEELLKSAPFGVLLVSHDRYLLENATNRVVELGRAFPEGFFSSSGAYSDFLEKKQEFLDAQVSQQIAMESRVRREVEWLKRGAKARTTKAKGRIESAGRMMAELAELKVRNAQGRTAVIDFNGTDRKTRKLVVAQGISKSLGGRLLIKGLDLILSPGMRLGLLGPNGSGKTTLLQMLAGNVQPDEGQLRRAEDLRVVHFQQGRAQLDRSLTLRRALSPKSDIVVHRDGTTHISSWAKRFLFKTEQLDLPVGDLSGGEQARVLIAQMMLQPADLLLLDEPTNDLDIPTLEVLEENLESFAGAVVLVTHDRYMIDRLATDVLGLDGRGGAQLYASLAQWEQAQASPEPQAPEPKKAATKPAPAPKPASKRLTYMEQREWEQMEGNIMTAESELEAVRKEMEDPAVLADRARLNECCVKMHEAEERVRKLYARWEELEAKQQ